MHGDWLTPEWSAPARVRAVCTSRSGGVSNAPYDSLNLGDHVGDDPSDVARNRALFAQALQATPVFLQQVHGCAVVALDSDTPEATQADACVSTEPALACTIMVADCLPVLLTNRHGNAVAAAHAGWRGLAGSDGAGILEAVVLAFCAQAPTSQARAASDTMAWLGPCIGPEAFEVGEEVRHAFVSHDAAASAMFKPQGGGKWLADLQGLARMRLRGLGISQVSGNDGSARWCTVGNPSRFFSHRRDRVGGRLAASVWLT